MRIDPKGIAGGYPGYPRCVTGEAIKAIAKTGGGFCLKSEHRLRSSPNKGCLDYLTGKKLSNSVGWLEARVKLLVLAKSHRGSRAGRHPLAGGYLEGMIMANVGISLMSTLKGSMLDGFFPAGWDLEKIDACCANHPNTISDRQTWWHPDFGPVPCTTIADFDTMMGHEIALQIRRTRDAGRQLALILPVGPMGMYRWALYFLKEWNVPCDHVHGFNMDEWSDADGNTLPPDNPGAFRYAMEQAFYGPLGGLTVPPEQRHFATRDILPTYAERIAALKNGGAELIVVFGIGRVFHIAFWEPHFAGEFTTDEEWKRQTYRLGAKLHPLTVEQNAITSFKSRTTLVPARANTIGPGLFLQADRIVGGADGMLGRGMMWQGMSLWVTLRYGPSRWVPSSFMPTLPGRLYFLKEMAGPLEAECN